MAHPIEFVKKLFSVTPETERELLSLMCERRYRRGERIDGRAEMRNHLFFIVEGMARVYYYKNGHDQTTSFALDNEFIMLNQSLLNYPDVVMGIEFLETTRVIYMPHHSLSSTIDKETGRDASKAHPFLLAGLITHIRGMEERMLVLQNNSARQRYKWMAMRYPRVLERASIPQIASYLGLTKETLYRIRSDKYTAK